MQLQKVMDVFPLLILIELVWKQPLGLCGQENVLLKHCDEAVRFFHRSWRAGSSVQNLAFANHRQPQRGPGGSGGGVRDVL